MAKNGLQQQQQKKADNGAAAQPAPESIDHVRDLLFGGQMRLVEARIQNLDERLSHETNAMRAEFERQVTELDNAIKKELARHTERLVAEKTKRVEDMKALSAELKDSLKSLEKRHTNLEEAAGLADAELRDHLMRQSAALTSDLNRTSERITSELNRITTQLQSDKLDASLISQGLTELAAKLVPSQAGKKQART
jgi:hypothetical protein